MIDRLVMKVRTEFRVVAPSLTVYVVVQVARHIPDSQPLMWWNVVAWLPGFVLLWPLSWWIEKKWPG